jgi:hypothetical protein
VGQSAEGGCCEAAAQLQFLQGRKEKEDMKPDWTDIRFEDMVRAATSINSLKKGSEESKWPTRVVLLLRASAVTSLSNGDSGNADADGEGEKASSTNLHKKLKIRIYV